MEKTKKTLTRLSFPMNMQLIKNQWDFEANRLISPPLRLKRLGKHSIYPQASLPARQGILLSPGENGRFPLLHNREYAGTSPIYLCCLSAGVVVFLLAENRKLPVRIGMGAIAFFLVSLIVTLLVVL